MNGKSIKSRLLASSVIAGAAFAAQASMTATAQETAETATPVTAVTEEDVARQETVVVTGSILAGETASPVTTMTAENFDARGIVTISDAVTKLSANNAGTIPQNWNVGFNFATGATAISLRGLTTSSTLTVFDGLRMAPYPLADDGRRNFVDLNAIPQGIVDRVEVLRDGASSTYGADAIAGVVNVITKKEIQGVHADASYGIAQEGDGQELRFGLTMGKGDLDLDGFNVYVAGEYQDSEAIYPRDRGYPFNTWDWSDICGPSGSCLDNGNPNGIEFDGSFDGVGKTRVPMIRPYQDGAAVGPYELGDPTKGCQGLTEHVITAEQAGDSTAWPAGTVVCEQNIFGDYYQASPDITRSGLASRATFRLDNGAEVYARADWYRVTSMSSFTPYGWNGDTAPPGQIKTPLVLLPVYVCPTGTETCDASNGTLNPQNPYAAEGYEAQILGYPSRQRSVESQADTFRAAAGIDGSFGNGWDYSADLSISHVDLDITRNGYIVLQNLLDVVADGSFNFIDQSANTRAQYDALMPESVNNSTSDVIQGQATLKKDLFELPGGPLQAAVGVAWREEKIDNPSANPANDLHPTERYYNLNSVGAVGSRQVWSGFFEADAPILDNVNVNISGRYDEYSSGQDNFSPKIGIKWDPIQTLSLRGTYSEGFRIPSFNESFGLPTTGYISQTLDADDPGVAEFIAAHASNPAYTSGTYNVGLTSSGNPGLDPEESKSYTLGAVWSPTSDLQFTVDYWKIEVSNLITNVNYGPAIEAYYAQGGVVNLDGITVRPGTIDLENPNALPLLGFIEYSYTNADSQEVSGVDFSAKLHKSLPMGLEWTSVANVSYLDNYEKTYDDGTTESYAGTLSPCDVTSCSGAPDWRWDWQNTIDYNDTSVTLTAYYTAGLDLASTDYGGVKGDCANNIGASVYPYNDGTPSLCSSDDILYFDLTASHKVNEKLSVYMNVLNLLNSEPNFDPSAAYSLYGYNPAWDSSGFIGRYFRIGAKVDF
ncbi:TonB-dependent receptor domain-containing protein [Hyphomonas sp.]|uniref:TonB-dependent receptor domain-containing protein n=1 Tax=Hyphomonas sp. TaxID=87 RepID=UPI003526F0DF